MGLVANWFKCSEVFMLTHKNNESHLTKLIGGSDNIILVNFDIQWVEPSIKHPPRKGQPPNKERNSGPLSHSSSSLLTSKKRTTSQQKTKWLVLYSEVPL